MTDLTSALGQTPLFGALPEADRAAVAKRMVPVSYPAGALIFARGDAGRDIHLVTAGRVKMSVVTAEGRELTLLHAGPGDIVGEIAALDGGPRTTDAHAVGTVETMRLGRDVLLGLVETNPLLARQAIYFLCQRLRSTNDALEGIALYPIESRIARFLLSAAKLRGGTPDGQGFTAVQLGISQGDLALLIGASRPKVSAALQSLEAAGSISRAGDVVRCDLDALARVAEAG